MSEQYHLTEAHYSRHFGVTVEVYCSTIDERKVVLEKEYLRYCPMCGGSVEVEDAD